MTEQTEQTTNVVQMEDGTTIDFGKRGVVDISIDLKSATMVFKTVNGKVISWQVQEIDNLFPFQKKVYLYGVLSKIRTAMAPVDRAELEDFINKQIEAINAGIFNVRAFGDPTREVKLLDIQKAYAIAKSKQTTGFEHWANVDDVRVIGEVLGDWATKSASAKNKIRRNPYVQLELSLLQTAKHPEAGSEL